MYIKRVHIITINKNGNKADEKELAKQQDL